MKIALISTPWAPSDSPTIALGALKSVLQQHGHYCKCFYSSNRFYEVATEVLNEGVDYMMEIITMDPGLLIYDWLFSRTAFGPHPKDKHYIDFYLQNYLKDQFVEMREQFEKLMDEIAREPWDEYDYIGFSCTHSQTIPSLALAKCIHREHPEVPLIFGGCAVDAQAAVELAKFSHVSLAIIGEGEKALIDFLENPTDEKVINAPSLTAEEFSNLPVPDYDEFYAEIDSVECSIEGSRGCWYGDKITCSFCGMVPEAKFRPNRNIIDNIKQLANKYNVKRFEFSDLLIPSSFIHTVFPKTQDLNLHFHYNIRADTFSQNHLDKLEVVRKGGTDSFFEGTVPSRLYFASQMVQILWIVAHLVFASRNSICERRVELQGFGCDSKNDSLSLSGNAISSYRTAKSILS